MKKFISLLSAVAVVFTLISTVAFAADDGFVITPVNKTANSVDINFALNTTYTDVVSIAMYIDVSDAVDKGATITPVNGAATVKYVAAQKMITVAYKDMNNTPYTSGDIIGTIQITNITENFNISLKDDSARTTTKVSSTAEGDVTAPIRDSFKATVTMQETPAGEVTGITIDPTEATVNGGETQTFTVAVQGTGEYDATYTLSATAGTFEGDVFTAPEAKDEEQTITVTATANGDGSKTATATVTVPAKEVVVEPSAELGTIEKGGDMYGQNTAVTSMSFANVAAPKVKISLDTESKEYELPSGVVGGTTRLIGIVRYAKGTTGTFTITVLDGAEELASDTFEAVAE